MPAPSPGRLPRGEKEEEDGVVDEGHEEDMCSWDGSAAAGAPTKVPHIPVVVPTPPVAVLLFLSELPGRWLSPPRAALLPLLPTPPLQPSPPPPPPHVLPP